LLLVYRVCPQFKRKAGGGVVDDGTIDMIAMIDMIEMTGMIAMDAGTDEKKNAASGMD
jgi:hypothetical protein